MNPLTKNPSIGAAQVADALLATGLEAPCAPALRPLTAGSRVIGPARPARHFGSVDIFLEAIDAASPGDVLVADNGGRLDEGCIGDLVALEAKKAGIAGIVIFGANRDTAQLRAIGLPVWSLGVCARGPVEARKRTGDCLQSARLGDLVVTREHWIVADDDGVVVAPAKEMERVLAKAEEIALREGRQSDRMRGGETLRAQLDLPAFLEARRGDPSYEFRAHLRRRDGAIEV